MQFGGLSAITPGGVDAIMMRMRMQLVPALAALMGNANWWGPRSCGRPHSQTRF